MAVVYDRLVGSDADGNLSPAVQQILDARITDLATGLIPATNLLQPLLIGDGSATIPVRPTTNQPVAFITTTFVPPGGTVAGGTAKMIVGTDVWINPAAMSGSGSGGVQPVVENPIGSGTYPNRPATSQSVPFKGVVQPNGGGTVAGGTPLMVDNLDEWVQWVVQ